MNWFHWLYLGIAILDGLVKVIKIGEPREPRVGIEVAFDLVVNGLLAAGVIYYGTR